MYVPDTQTISFQSFALPIIILLFNKMYLGFFGSIWTELSLVVSRHHQSCKSLTFLEIKRFSMLEYKKASFSIVVISESEVSFIVLISVVFLNDRSLTLLII